MEKPKSPRTAKTKAAKAMASLTRSTFPINFAELSRLFLDEARFFSDVVPAFEKVRNELVEIIAEDHQLASTFASTRLVILDNRRTEQKMHFWLTREYATHCYLYDQHQGLKDYDGFSSPTISMLQAFHGNILQALTCLFVGELLGRATPEDLAFHIERYLKINYVDVEKINNAHYLLFRVANYTFATGLFSISAYRLNLVIPFVNELDASEIVDGTWGYTRILLTVNADTTGYTGFDCVVGETNWHSNFAYLRFGFL
jgi:hypothetical protein